MAVAINAVGAEGFSVSGISLVVTDRILLVDELLAASLAFTVMA